MRVGGQLHAPAALYSREKDRWYPLDRRLGGPQKLEERFSCLCWESNLYRPDVQSVARHYTD